MPASSSLQILKTLAHADPAKLAAWLTSDADPRVPRILVLCLGLGCGAYGLTIGLWRAPLQGLYVAIKMPALVALTLTVNGLINGMLAVLLHSGLSFRQTLQAQLMSFAIFGLIVGSLSPIVMAMVLDAPPADSPEASGWYAGFLLTHTFIIAFAGIVANHKLLQLLQNFSGSCRAGWTTLTAWLAGNLFVGAQLSYNLRPFFGNPDLPVQFLRPNPFDGSFYESVWQLSFGTLSPDQQTHAMLWSILTALLFGSLGAMRFSLRRIRRSTSPQTHEPHP
jgi:hypothetical protein